MNRKFILGSLLLLGIVSAHAQFTPVTRNANIATSENFPVNEGGIHGYVRASAWGFGQDGGENGSENYDFASTFAEAGIRANYKKGFGEGYFIFAGEARLRYGQYLNGKMDNKTNIGTAINTNDRYKTTLDLKDLYVGYRSHKWEVILGNQNVQWGRGLGSNPTNNISPSDMLFLSANPEDKKMYNFMLITDFQFRKGLDLQVVAVPMVRSSYLPLQAFNLGGLNMLGQTIPEAKIKNGTIAARLNLNNGPMGASISYYNGCDPFPNLHADWQDGDPSKGQVMAWTENCRKQTIGADFCVRISGEMRGGNFVPTNDWMITGEFAYNFYKNPNNVGYIPQDNFAFTLGLLKIINMSNNVDAFTIGMSWYGKYTPNYKTLKFDLTNPVSYMEDMNVSLGRFFNGQQAKLDHTLMLILSQSALRKKLSFSLMCSYGLIKPTDITGSFKDKNNATIYPQANYNISKNLSLSAGYMRMFGANAPYYGPIMGGCFVELKAKI